MSPSSKQLSAVSAALKGLRSSLIGKVIDAAGDEATAHEALWTLVRNRKIDVSKNWMMAFAFEGCPGRVTWADLLAFLESLPDGLVSPGGGKLGYGFFLLGNPTYGALDVPRPLASLAARAASDDRVEASKPDSIARPAVLQLVLDYGRGVAGITLAGSRAVACSRRSPARS